MNRMRRPTFLVGRICLWIVLAACCSQAAWAQDAAQLIERANAIKTLNYPEFTSLLEKIDSEQARLSPTEEENLRYLKAWQNAYLGKYETAIAELKAIDEHSRDVTLRVRANITLVNVLSLARRYEDAFSHLNLLSDLLPQVADDSTREQGLLAAALLYNQVGQYELGISYAVRLLQQHQAGKNACIAEQLKLEAIYKTKLGESPDAEMQAGLDVCAKAGEFIYASVIRTYMARIEIARSRYTDAIDLLEKSYSEVQQNRYARLISEWDSLLALAYWQMGNLGKAKAFAARSIENKGNGEYAEPQVDSYRVLYLSAQKENDFQTALAFHEKFAAADKGYLNDVSARTLAYQIVTQQVIANKLQIDALNKQNEVLQLQQALGNKASETTRLYLLLLLTVLGFIVAWAYRTKRSQLRFKKLARRDGLTGIFNRQHFVDAAGQVLEYCRKSSRDACVVVIDLDHFKLVNDVHGHAAGDLVLKRAIAACEVHLRSVDVFGRLGGEEFGILLADCEIDKAVRITEQLRVAISEVSGGDSGIDFPVSASFGVSATRTSGYKLTHLLGHADRALYQAKREGRNRVVAHDSATVDADASQQSA